MKPPRAPDDNDPVALRKHIEQLNKVITNLSFGSKTFENGQVTAPAAGNSSQIAEPEGNIDGNKFVVSFPAAPNTDITVTHNLGRIPVGWLVLRSTNQGHVYLSPTLPTKTTITLRETQGSQVALIHFL